MLQINSNKILISRVCYGDNFRVWIPNNLLEKSDGFWINQFLVKFDHPVCKEVFILNTLSCWGGPDKKDEKFTSWEFPGDMNVTAIYYLMTKLFPKGSVRIG